MSSDLIVCADFSHHAGGYEAVSKLLQAPKRPTAILVVSNNMALGVLQALQDRGIDVPTEMAVVGFGDTPSAALLSFASHGRCPACARDRRNQCQIIARAFAGPEPAPPFDRSRHRTGRA